MLPFCPPLRPSRRRPFGRRIFSLFRRSRLVPAGKACGHSDFCLPRCRCASQGIPCRDESFGDEEVLLLEKPASLHPKKHRPLALSAAHPARDRPPPPYPLPQRGALPSPFPLDNSAKTSHSSNPHPRLRGLSLGHLRLSQKPIERTLMTRPNF